MTINNYNIIPSKILIPKININFPLNFNLNLQNKLESPFPLNFSSKYSDEEEDSSFFNKLDSLSFIPSMPDDYNKSQLNELFLVDSIKFENGIISFDSFKKSNLFTNTGKNNFLFKEYENNLLKKRFREKRPRKENQDNIRRKIKRGFFNNGLIKKLNDKLRSIGIIKYFEKFPHHFVNDVNRKKNKQILGMTLKEIFENKELYFFKDKIAFDNYLHNIKVVQNEEIKENEELKTVFNKTICELYEEYINSDDFKISEISRLKRNKMQDDYITKYINLAKYLVDYFSQ